MDKPKQEKWTHHLSDEDKYYPEDRKETKLQRKIIRSTDRSKYKKTDQDKLQKSQEAKKGSKLVNENVQQGRVLSVLSKGVIVECKGKIYTCVLRGIMKKERGTLKNLVTVGDLVLFEKTSEDEGAIAEVEPRRTILSRADNLSRRKEQLIASNIDQVLITTSVVDPPLKPFLIDRYIIAAKIGGMEPVIVINKIDLLKGEETDFLQQERALYQEFISAYAAAGISVVSLSVATGQGIDDLCAAMKDKVSVFSGQSGVGKTSLINLITGLSLRVGRTVEKTRKGSHTTTSTQLLPLDFGGWCIDTPGIKSFGVWDLKKEEIEGYFLEIHEKGGMCKFPDCSHTHEAHCAVIEAVEQGEISALRYHSYHALIESISRTHIRR